MRQKKLDRRHETGDMRQETRTRRCKTEERRQEIGILSKIVMGEAGDKR